MNEKLNVITKAADMYYCYDYYHYDFSDLL